MNLTRADVALLGRRALQPERAPGELLAVFCAGPLTNTKNARLHWGTEARYKARWREAVAQVVLEASARHPATVVWLRQNPGHPKRVTLPATTPRELDPDGLIVACAPILDGLGVRFGLGFIHDDRASAGHFVEYGQTVDRKAPAGIRIGISLRGTGPAPGDKSPATMAKDRDA